MPFRENTATSEVVALSNNSTVSDFNPDQDALMSPQRPNPRRAGSHGVVKAQNQFVHLDKNLDYAIDTSALRAALPEFSDGTSSGDEEEDVSIEIGRGARDRNYRLDDSRDSFMSLEDSRISGSPAGSRSGNRPALRNISNRTALRNSDALRRDAQIRRASLVAQKENINPKATKPKGNPTSGTQKGSKQHRRTLSEMHARVSETYDGSYLSDERPPNGYVTSKTTRFGNSKPYSQHKITLAVKNAAAGGKADNGWTEHSNHESFLLPDVENLSELVSGIYHDGMAVNAQPKRPRTTRFTSPPAVEMPNPNTDTHAHFDAVPIPADEKALFASLRLLQRKVLSLEKTNEEAEDQLERLRRENTILRADPLRQNRYESDDEEPPRGGAASLAVVKGRLEAAIAALRNQLETANHKVSGQESVIQKATEERNSVINQLGSVYLTCEELRADNQTLRRENSHLKAQLVGLMAGPEGYELGTKHRREPTEPRKDQTRPMEEKGNTHHATHTTQPRLDVRESQGHDLPPRRDDAARQTGTEKNEQYEALFSLGAHSSRPVDYKRSKSESGEKKLPNTGRQRTKRVSGNGGDATDYSIIDTRNIQIQTLTQDLTHLTFIDSREIAQLRQTLEEERVARKQGRILEFLDRGKARTRSRSRVDLTRSSFKDVTKMSTKAAADATNHTRNGDATAEAENQDAISHRDDFTRASSRRGSRPNDDAAVEEMTSAFILPDITIHNQKGATATIANIQLSAAAQRVLDDAVRHERGNCTACQKEGSCPADNNANIQSISIPKPIPVSERPVGPMAECTDGGNGGEHDHTLRPSQSPGLALAKVLKILEDELSHLKMQLAVCQSRYSRHDAAMGRKRRLQLGDKMKELMAEIENRSEVVYALYDVLEGQKGDVEVVGVRGDGQRRAGYADDSDLEDEALPWEGFESTQDDVTGRSRVRR